MSQEDDMLSMIAGLSAKVAHLEATVFGKAKKGNPKVDAGEDADGQSDPAD